MCDTMQLKLIVVVVLLALGARAISVYDREELMELNEQLSVGIERAIAG